MNTLNIEKLNWEKNSGLLPAIVQDVNSGQVLMLGYMNRESLAQTLATKLVTFYSRSKQRLWTKGETSGNFLLLKTISVDCDQDTLLLQVEPKGPCCHLETNSCFGDKNNLMTTINNLEKTLLSRFIERPENSYTTSLFEKGIKRIAQKVGEEGLEVALAGVAENNNALINESADLIYHLLVLLTMREIKFSEILQVLQTRADVQQTEKTRSR